MDLLQPLFSLCRCHLLRATALIVRENNPFERAGKTFRLSMDVTRLRRAVRTRYANSASLDPNKKHPKAFARYLPGTIIALKVLHGLLALRAYSGHPRQD